MNSKKTNKVYSILNYPKKDEIYGNFKGRYPAQAAHKALNFLAKKTNMKNTNNMNHIMFYLVNVKNGKKYCYIGSRIELVKPKVIKFKNKEKPQFFYFKTILRKCNINKS